MARNGYVIFTVTAKVRFRRGAEPIPLDDLTGKGHDLLHEVAREAQKLTRHGVRRIDRYEQAYEVTRWDGHTGTLFVDGALGGYGTPGNTVNVDTNARRPYTDRDANMTDLTALLAVAPDAREAVLVCERRGGSHLKNVFEQALLRPIENRHRLTINIDTHVDLEAWRQYLDGAIPNKVTAVWRSQRDEDYQPDSRKLPELKMTAEGGMAERVGLEVLRAARRKATREPMESIRIRDLTPRDTENYADPRYEIAVTDAAGTQRTVVIEREQLPQWVYPMAARRATRTQLRATFAEHAASILSSEVGATLPEGWASRRWPVALREEIEAVDDDGEAAGIEPPRT
jgi:hypothetical protein